MSFLSFDSDEISYWARRGISWALYGAAIVVAAPLAVPAVISSVLEIPSFVAHAIPMSDASKSSIDAQLRNVVFQYIDKIEQNKNGELPIKDEMARCFRIDYSPRDIMQPELTLSIRGVTGSKTIGKIPLRIVKETDLDSCNNPLLTSKTLPDAIRAAEIVSTNLIRTASREVADSWDPQPEIAKSWILNGEVYQGPKDFITPHHE